MSEKTHKRRSQAWFGGMTKDSFIHRSWMRNQGLPDDTFDGRPIIGIAQTFSELTPCNAHFREVAEHVKRGVLDAGGVPFEFPVFSCAESNARPTAMLFRNLASMDVEEAIRGLPIDGVVLLTGCDKTTPSLVMGTASCDVPAIVVPGGPMLNGRYRGELVGSGTHVWKYDQMVKAGEMTPEEYMGAEAAMSRSKGHCMTMGTASTMGSMVEALGLTLPGAAAIPAVDSRHALNARLSGRRIVDMVEEDLKISKILTKEAFENAIRANGAIGGSTNAVVHLLAMAGRIGVDLTLDDWDRLGRDIPTIVNLMPSGKYLMEDFFYAGGVPAVMRALLENDKLHTSTITVNGKTQAENVKEAERWGDDVILDWDKPLVDSGGIAVLRGNLATDGSIIKPSAATPSLMKHRGRAVVFEDIEDYKAKIEDPDLNIDETCVMVLKGAGPKGYPGFAEVGNMGLPPKVLQKGITDIVRISDGRMSGTAYGTVVLHCAPEAAAGGNIALVRNGDMISLDVEKRSLVLEVSDEELARRRAAWVAPVFSREGGYQGLYRRTVMQADTGCDLDFLVGCRGAEIPRESH